jgi:hypothetical protein
MENKTPGFEILGALLDEMERVGTYSLPSLNQFLNDKQLYLTKEDIKELRKFLKDKKYKLVQVVDHAIIKRGHKR